MSYLSLDTLFEKVPALSTDSPSPEVSDRYVFIPSSKVVEDIMSLGDWTPIEGLAKKNRRVSRRKYGKHGVSFRHPNLTYTLPNGDEIFTELTFINSHDRTNTFRFYGGLYSQKKNSRIIVPANVLSGEKSTFFRVKHIYYNVDTLKSTLADITEMISNNSVIVKTLTESSISSKQERDFIMKALLRRSLVNPTEFNKYMLNIPSHTIEVIQAPDFPEDEGQTAWDVLTRTQRKMIEGFVAYDPVRKKVARFKPISSFDRKINISTLMYSDFLEALAQ